MSPQRATNQPNVTLWRKLLACFSLEWVAALLELLPTLSRWLAARQPSGLYEFLLYDATLELLDAQGHTAIFRKHQRVRFLQDNLIAFEDYVWGDGDIFAQYRVSPGVAVDRYQEGDRWNVLISLRESKQQGQVEEIYIDRVVQDGFTTTEEWQQAEIRHQTDQLRLSILFPQERPCKKASIRLRRRNKTIPLGPDHFHTLTDGRQMVRWEAENVSPLEVVTLNWSW